MRKHFAASLVLATCCVGGLAQAADLPRRGYTPEAAYGAAVPVFTWTGAYAGLNAGYNTGRFSGDGRRLFGSNRGGIVGATGGYNYQMDHVVVGVEGDFGWDGARGARGFPFLPAYARSKLNDLLTVRGRVGYAVDRTLLFATGGYAGGSTTSRIIDLSLPAGQQNYSSSNWHHGYALGAGLEYAFTNTISAKAEYLYTSLGTTGMFTSPHYTNAGVHENVVRGGVNYHF